MATTPWLSAATFAMAPIRSKMRKRRSNCASFDRRPWQSLTWFSRWFPEGTLQYTLSQASMIYE